MYWKTIFLNSRDFLYWRDVNCVLQIAEPSFYTENYLLGFISDNEGIDIKFVLVVIE